MFDFIPRNIIFYSLLLFVIYCSASCILAVRAFRASTNSDGGGLLIIFEILSKDELILTPFYHVVSVYHLISLTILHHVAMPFAPYSYASFIYLYHVAL